MFKPLLGLMLVFLLLLPKSVFAQDATIYLPIVMQLEADISEEVLDIYFPTNLGGLIAPPSSISVMGIDGTEISFTLLANKLDGGAIYLQLQVSRSDIAYIYGSTGVRWCKATYTDPNSHNAYTIQCGMEV